MFCFVDADAIAVHIETRMKADWHLLAKLGKSNDILRYLIGK